MRDLGSLIIVHLVEPAPVGKVFPRKRASWPLHVTLVPWFYITDDKRGALLGELRQYAAANRPLIVHVGGEERLGPDKVPVNLLVEQTPVRKLHDDLIKLVERYDAEPHKNASPASGIERPYRAHITHHTAPDGVLHRRFPGDTEVFGDITIARLLEDNGTQMCEIIATISLGQGHETAA